MKTSLRVAIAPVPRRSVAEPARPLLAAAGAAVVLGSAATGDDLAIPVVPSNRTMFGPRGACISADGGLWVADTGHHRLLGWSRLPEQDSAAAEILIGQPDFAHEGRNAKGEPGAATLNVPSGVTACGAGIAVADGWNHRVLIWRETPSRHNQPADLVLGQRDFSGVQANHGADAPAADTMHWPFGVAWDGERLWVADAGNRRVLMWQGLPTRSGQPADLVLGQRSFLCRDENGGGAPDSGSMRWPHGITFLEQRLCVSDAGNNRIMVWERLPTANGQPCDIMLGQRNATGVDHNQGDYWPGASALNMPYAVTTIGNWLVAADTASSRLVAWRIEDIKGFGAKAQRLAGQPDWESKGDNRWLPAARDSLCWPYGLDSSSSCAVISDAGNNRVLLWPWNTELNS
jgi:hypothetical protein